MNFLLTIFETSLYISDELWFDFLSRFLAYTLSLFILIRYIFYPYNGQTKFLFVFFLTGLMIFLISSTLDKITLHIGMALGLFAIFGIIRFRTPSVGLKEMTYLFISIGMAVINALVEFNLANWFGLVIANLIILNAAYIMERYKPKVTILRKTLIFSPTNYQVLTNNELLKNEIKEATGIDILKADISRINKVKNEVTVMISFKLSSKMPAELPTEKESIEEQNSSDNFNWKNSENNNYYSNKS